MKITAIIALILSLCTGSVYGQVPNRRQVIDMILKEHFPKELTGYSYSGINIQKTADTKQSSNMFYNPIPRFQLPQGAVVCRFEEYVQLHTPFKLNIGVGGE
jgi:hypothetical protein